MQAPYSVTPSEVALLVHQQTAAPACGYYKDDYVRDTIDLNT